VSVQHTLFSSLHVLPDLLFIKALYVHCHPHGLEIHLVLTGHHIAGWNQQLAQAVMNPLVLVTQLSHPPVFLWRVLHSLTDLAMLTQTFCAKGWSVTFWFIDIRVIGNNTKVMTHSFRQQQVIVCIHLKIHCRFYCLSWYQGPNGHPA